MVNTKQIKITLTEEDAKRFQKLSENSGLSKSILANLMLGGTLRDLRNNTKSESARLIYAWASKPYEKMIEGIYVY